MATQKRGSHDGYDVVVVGGGPSGMMAAGRAAELGARVLLLEKNPTLGKKLLITGGGRSNVTNAEPDMRVLLAKYGKNAKFLFSAFAKFSHIDAVAFFHAKGMPTITEAEGRVFPKTERSQSVLDCLVRYMQTGGVIVETGIGVAGFDIDGDRVTHARRIDGKRVSARAFILATGGTSRPDTGSTGDGFRWLSELGHPVRTPDPALVPVGTSDAWMHKLSGLAFQRARVTLASGGTIHDARIGKVLFTHFGLSGPLILNMSRMIGELLRYGPTTLAIDLFPDEDQGTLDRRFHDTLRLLQNKKLRNALEAVVPSALAHAIPAVLQLDAEKQVNKVSREERIAIVKFLKAVPATPTKVLGVEKAVVVSGGIALSEIDTRTFASLRYPNLFVTGDVLDIDRPSGGYSLQLCWTSGYVAGTSAAEHTKHRAV